MVGSIVTRKGKDGKPHYYVVVWVGGKAQWITAGTKRAIAEQILAEKVTAINQGTYRKNIKITFRDFTEKFMKNHTTGRVRESTRIRYQQLIDLHLLPHLGDYQLSAIGVEMIENYMSAKAKENEISSATINRSRTLLHEIFSCAIKWKYLSENPVQYVEPLKEVKKEMEFLRPHEIKPFLNAVPKDYYALFLAAITLGMRRGELYAMRWGNLDEKKRQYFVRESLDGRRKFGETKTTKKRAVDVPPVLLAALKTHRVEQNKRRLKLGPDWQDHDLIFPSSLGTPISPGHIELRVFKPAVERAGVRKIRFHDLRHTNAALRIHDKQSPLYISRQLGHSSIQVTFDLYGHLMEEANQQAAQNLENLIFKNQTLL